MIYAESMFLHASFLEATIICILLIAKRSSQAYILSVAFTLVITVYTVALFIKDLLSPIISFAFMLALVIASFAKVILLTVNRINLGYGIKSAIGAVLAFMLQCGLISYAAYNGSQSSLVSAIIQAITMLPVAWWLIISNRIHKVDSNSFLFNRKHFDD